MRRQGHILVQIPVRRGGTSLAGQCTHTAVVLDWTKYCHHVVSVDAGERTCVVEPGIVLDVLNAQAPRQQRQSAGDHQAGAQLTAALARR